MGENLPWQNVAISVWGGPAIRFTLERRSPPVVSPVKLPLEQGFRRKAFVTLLPFLKWPGGKRWLIARHSAAFPATFGRYFEPFLGAGSVFFHLRPDRAVLGDKNGELVELFRVVAWRRKQLETSLQEHQRKHGERHYYGVRGSIPTNPVERAARTLYLNRTCFNGMYRVNLAGHFNVPKGEKTAVVMDTDDFLAAAKLLRRTELRVSDFEPLVEEAKVGDLVFADPPYIVGHNNNGFVKYNELLFKWDDQVRLANALARARDRGVKVVSTNAAHSAVERLYRRQGFSLRRVERYSSLSGVSEGRCQFQEVIISANCD
jgi:DNA adenine methylase